MGHELRPRSGEAPKAADVERLLRTEFPYVNVDAEEGTRQALALADWIEGRPAWIFMGKHEAWLERAKQLRTLPLGEAVGITCGDDRSGLTIHFVLIPGDVVKFGYRGAEDEQRLRPLVDRCARALDSDVVLF